MLNAKNALIRGALAGVAGTAVMTLAMRALAPRMMPDDMLPEKFPPQRVVERAEELAGDPRALTEREEMQAAYVSHFAYGGASGAAYGLLRNGIGARLPASVAGSLFGIALWAFGYEWWMPAVGVQRATTEHEPRRWAYPILTHVVYGATTAVAYDRLQ